MRFLFLIHGDAEAEAALTADERRAIVGEHMAYAAMLRERGAYVSRRGARERRRGGRATGREAVRDRRPVRRDEGGVGGFYVVDVREPRRRRSSSPGGPLEPGLAVEVLTIAEI